MSQENVEIVRSIYEAVDRGDWDAVYRDAHPDFELTTPPRIRRDVSGARGSSGGTGRASLRHWRAWTFDPEEIFESQVRRPSED